MVCAFATNQYTHGQTGPSVEAVPETLLSLRGLVSDVPEVSTTQFPHLCVSTLASRQTQRTASLGPIDLQSREGVPSCVHVTAT